MSDPKKKGSFDSSGSDPAKDFGDGFSHAQHGSPFDTGEVFKNIFGRFSRGSPFADLFRNSSAETNSFRLNSEVPGENLD